MQIFCIKLINIILYIYKIGKEKLSTKFRIWRYEGFKWRSKYKTFSRKN